MAPNDIMKQFGLSDTTKDNYVLGQIISIPSYKEYEIRTLDGLVIKIKDKFGDYKIGDRLVLSEFGNPNRTFIVKKAGIFFPELSNRVVSNGEG